jgi:hypothetical protein
MRVVLACRDIERADWLAHILGNNGLSVVVLPEVTASSPELKGADLLILDAESASTIGEAGSIKRVLLSARGTTIELEALTGKYADILVVPAPDDEVVARIQHALGQ